VIVVVSSAFLCLANLSATAASDVQDMEGIAILQKYAAAAEKRDVVAAVGHLLDYSVLTEGEYAPQTAQLTHRYGVLLSRSGEHRQAVNVLKIALERSKVAFGEFAGEAFDINMNIGYAYGHLGRRRFYGIEYFDRALEVLRQRGERESVAYVSALLNIVASLADNDGLSGDTATTVANNFSDLPGNERLLNLEYEYRRTGCSGLPRMAASSHRSSASTCLRTSSRTGRDDTSRPWMRTVIVYCNRISSLSASMAR
jgi:tetratricopeptide (TPR) repeat protein